MMASWADDIKILLISIVSWHPSSARVITKKPGDHFHLLVSLSGKVCHFFPCANVQKTDAEVLQAGRTTVVDLTWCSDAPGLPQYLAVCVLGTGQVCYTHYCITVLSSILPMRKLRLRQVKQPAWDYTSGKWRAGIEASSESALLTVPLYQHRHS